MIKANIERLKRFLPSREIFKSLLYSIANIFKDGSAGLLFLYSIIPALDESPWIFMVYCLIILIISCTYNKFCVDSKSSWIMLILVVAGTLIDYWLAPIMILVVAIILFPFFIWYAKRKNFNKDLNLMFDTYIYIFGPLSFLFINLITYNVAILMIAREIINEEQYIYSFFITILVSVTIYVLSLSFKLAELFNGEGLKILNKVKIAWPIAIMIFLVLPDFLFSFVVYDMYLRIFKEESYNLFEMYYYSFSLHFLTPESDIGAKISGTLKKEDIGQYIYIVHMITVRVIDLTILANVSNLFSKSQK